MTNLVKCFIANEAGVAAIEYALIAAGIVLVGVAVLEGVATVTSGLFEASVVTLSPSH
jgi:Flp pilus assembly pilin Flp